MVPFEMHSTTAESTVYMFSLRDFAEEVYIIIMEW